MKWQDDSGLVSPASYHAPQDPDAGEDESFDRSRSTDSSFDNDETRYEGDEEPLWIGRDGEGYASGGQGLEDDETVFGAREAGTAPAQPGPASRHRISNMFALPDVTATYYGGRLEDAVGEESPTPWMRTAAGRGR